VLARRHRTTAGELDLVVRRGRLLVFVEVKRRADLAAAAAAVTPHQQRRIARAAALYLAAAPAELRTLDVRFDAVLVTPGALPTHVVDAFRPPADDIRA
jgi:putative endonuclease